MIAGDPRVIERAGKRVIGDANGDRLVCRQHRHHRGRTSRYYHQIDIEHFAATGVIRPACQVTTHSQEVTWLPRRQVDLAGIWQGCSFTTCFGEYEPSDPGPNTSGQTDLAATLEAMSVTEFDAIVADHQALRTDGGER